MGDLFQASIMSKISSGSPINKGPTQVAVTPVEGRSKSYSKSKMRQMIFTLAGGG